MLWVQHEISYEKFHENSERIYLIAWERLANNRHYKSTPAPFADRLQAEFPEFQNIVRISLHGQNLVRYKNHVFMEEQIAVADPSLFQMFTFPLVQGNRDNLLDEPNTVVLTESVLR
jgi:putative ABC transport system permease protein